MDKFSKMLGIPYGKIFAYFPRRTWDYSIMRDNGVESPCEIGTHKR